MAKRKERLSPKLEAVLARLCERLGSVTITSAAKLPYLVDVVANHALGAPITEGTHQTWKLGVVTSEVWHYIKAGGAPNDPFTIKDRVYLGGQPDDELTPEEQAIVDFVADLWGRLEARALGRLTKAVNTHLDPETWGRNAPASIGEDAYARLSPGWLAFCERLPSLDFSDESRWGDPIDNPAEYVKRVLGG